MARRPFIRGDLVYRTAHVTVHFNMNRSGIAAIAVGRQTRNVVEDWAKRRAMPYAISISPRSSKTDKKHYADSFVVRTLLVGAPPSEMIIGDPFPMMRWAARLVNTSEYAVAVEWGAKRSHRRQESHRVLGKTLARFRRPTRRRL